MHFSTSQEHHIGRIMRELDQAAKEPLPPEISTLVAELARVIQQSNTAACPHCGARRVLRCPVCEKP